MIDPCRLAETGVRVGRTDSETLLHGESRSIYRGQGYEYIDFKPYYIGEDTRYIDWRVSARYMTNPYTINLYMREYISEKQVETLFILDLHETLNFWDKLSIIIYTATLMYSLAHRLNDNTYTLILADKQPYVVPTTNPIETIEYMKKRICSLRKVRGESSLDVVERFITRYSKIRGFTIFTDYGVEPKLYTRIGSISRALNTSVGIVIATNKYEVNPPIKSILPVVAPTGETVIGDLGEIYEGIRIHVNECRARIRLVTSNYLEFNSLEHARRSKTEIMLLYLNVRTRSHRQIHTLQR